MTKVSKFNERDKISKYGVYSSSYDSDKSDINDKYLSKIYGNKSDRSSAAKNWLDKLESNSKFNDVVKKAMSSVFYFDNMEVADNIQPSYDNTDVWVFNQDVVVCTKAACTRHDSVAVLDFASYTNPGGGFLSGSMAQEEAICSKSGLYPILNKYLYMYEKHREDTKDGLYGSDFLYCRQVPFMVNNTKIDCYADVIVMAAPNVNRYSKSKYYDKSKVIDELSERMDRILYSAYLNGCDCVLLGAFGCGVFGNDVNFVAEKWNDLLCNKYAGAFKSVVHPVLDKSQYTVFRKYDKTITV